MAFGNPEFNAMYNLDRRTRTSTIEESTKLLLPHYEHAKSEVNRVSIDPTSFDDLYSTETINRDLRYVVEMEKKFVLSDTKKLADIAEYQIIKGVNTKDWIPDCQAIKTSHYDDIMNGVDMVMEFLPENGTIGQMGLGVDISFSRNLDEKFARIKDEIDKFDGKKYRLATVKYFQSPNSGFRGELSGIPRVVAALDVGVLQDITQNRRTEGHIARHILIEEMRQQLEVFVAYAKRVNPDCVAKIERALSFMSLISENLHSARTLKQSEYIKNRKIDDSIARNLEMFK